jgi:branched-chain amino acid transport system permease protein
LIIFLPLLARGQYAYLLPLAQIGGLYAILVTGLTLLMGFTGQVSLGHAGFYGFGAYVAAVAATNWGMPLTFAIPLALVAGAVLALVTGFMVLRLKGNLLALATLCLGVILGELFNKSKITGGAAGLFDLPLIDLWGWPGRSPLAKVYFIWIVVWLVVVLALRLTMSPAGRAMQAIHYDEEAAAALGVPVFALKLKVFVLAGLLAALAGVLYAFVYTPAYLGPEEFSLMLSVMLVTMVVLGGMGSIWGGLLGALVTTGLHEVITLVGEKLGFTQISRFEQLFFGALLILMLVFCPRGLVSSLAGNWLQRWRRRT